MDLVQQVGLIRIEKNTDTMLHRWLEGLSLIDNHANLKTASVNAFLEQAIQEHQPFTPLVSGGFLAANYTLFSDGHLRSIHLPISNDIHIQFYLEVHEFNERVHYVECKGFCRVLPPYIFPQADLKRSVDYSNNLEIMACIQKGSFCYDNTLPPREMTPDIIASSFRKFEEFINYSKKS